MIHFGISFDLTFFEEFLFRSFRKEKESLMMIVESNMKRLFESHFLESSSLSEIPDS